MLLVTGVMLVVQRCHCTMLEDNGRGLIAKVKKTLNYQMHDAHRGVLELSC